KRPTVAIHPRGYILETHESAHGDAVWYHTGKLIGTMVEWGGAFRFDSGETPAITATPDGRVVSVLNREKLWYKGKLWYHLGALQ
ncbi:MAG: hypothetical protein D6737_11190, partial [Chloroflexi bacterium]